jgi:hypothetical protein
MSDKLIIHATDTTTANPILPFEPFNSATFATADIAIRCTVCEEYTSMNSNDYRTQGVFICDKCKAAILHIRKLLEDGGSIV